MCIAQGLWWVCSRNECVLLVIDYKEWFLFSLPSHSSVMEYKLNFAFRFSWEHFILCSVFSLRLFYSFFTFPFVYMSIQRWGKWSVTYCRVYPINILKPIDKWKRGCKIEYLECRFALCMYDFSPMAWNSQKLIIYPSSFHVQALIFAVHHYVLSIELLILFTLKM